MTIKRTCVGVGKCYFRPYRFVVKVWTHYHVDGRTMTDPMPDFQCDEHGAMKHFTKDEADAFVAECKAAGHGADSYVDLRDEMNIFGGAAANDTVRVDDLGHYKPVER